MTDYKSNETQKMKKERKEIKSKTTHTVTLYESNYGSVQKRSMSGDKIWIKTCLGLIVMKRYCK